MSLDPRVADVRAFDLFLTAIETGSLSKTASRRGLSQPSVSARIRNLERQLGLELLQRSTSGVVPTPAGKAIARWAEEVLKACHALSDGVSALRGDHRALRIASSLTIAEHLVPTWLGRMRTKHPELSVELVVENSEHVLEDLRSGLVDLGFVEGPNMPRGFKTEVIAIDELIIIVGPQHPWAHRSRPVEPREVAETPFVLREQGSGTRLFFEKRLGEAGLAVVPPAAVLSSTTAVRAAIIAGVGPGVVSRLAVQADIDAGKLEAVHVDSLDLRRELRAVWRTANRPPILAALLGPAQGIGVEPMPRAGRASVPLAADGFAQHRIG